MKQSKFFVFALSLAIMLGASNTLYAKTDVVAEQSQTENSLNGIWKLTGIPVDFFIQFDNGVMHYGDSPTNFTIMAKYYVEGSTIVVTNTFGGKNNIPYSFEDGKLVVYQSGIREVYEAY